MSKADFSQINRQTADAFAKQRRIIKDLCCGKQVRCDKCQQNLVMYGPEGGKKGEKPGIYCAKGCTRIELEFE